MGVTTIYHSLNKYCLYQKTMVDCELFIDDCYLTVHNLISIKQINESSSESDVKTYIFSATKPFLIELLKNTSKDCICCPDNFNQHLNFK